MMNTAKNWMNRCRRARWARDERGATLVMVALAMFAIIAFAGLAIDGAIVMTARSQLHAAADAAALAGASGLLEGSQELAIERAIDYASYHEAIQDGMEPVVITEDDISFPAPDVCRVRTHRTLETEDPIRTYFLRLLDEIGIETADMTAVAAAKALDICGARCLKPWAVPDRWNDANSNGRWDTGELYDRDATGYVAPTDVGKSIVVKVGDPGQTFEKGFFYAVSLPPIGKYPGEDPLKGGDWYRRWIAECEPYMVEPGDRLLVEPGNMVGPTLQGARDLIAQDPTAKWDFREGKVVGSAFTLSPRIALVAFFDPTQPPEKGRGDVEVVKLGAFFIESVGPGSAVNARFVQLSRQGSPCPGGLGSSFVKTIVLVE